MEMTPQEIVKLVDLYKQLSSDLTSELLIYKVKVGVLEEQAKHKDNLIAQFTADKQAQKEPGNAS